MNPGKVTRLLLASSVLTAIVCSLAPGQDSVMAPVVDASTSDAWIRSLNGNAGSCQGGTCSAPSSPHGFAMMPQPNMAGCSTGCGSSANRANANSLFGSCATGCGSSTGDGNLFGLCGDVDTCTTDCNCGTCVACCKKKCCRVDVFGEFLYLRSRDAEVAYAVPIDGPITPVMGNGIQIGRTALVDMGFEPGFRFGFNLVGGQCSGVFAQWTHFESHTEDFINIGAPDVIRSLVTHPLGANAASDGLQSSAAYDIDFDLVDVGLKTPWKRCCDWGIDLIWGARYGQLQQQFTSSIDVNGSTDVSTTIDFEGVGPQLGFLTQRRLGCKGLFHVYGRGDASFMVGKFDARYRQQDTFAGTVVDTSWESGRIVSQLELEIGVGIASKCGRKRLRAGYMVNSWFNTVRTNEYINAVQQNNPDDLGSRITFDGLVVRGELRF